MRITTSHNLDQHAVFDTPQSYSEALDLIRNFAVDQPVESITNGAGGVAGPFDQERRKLVNAPHLQDWIGKPIADDLEEIFSAPVFLEMTPP